MREILSDEGIVWFYGISTIGGHSIPFINIYLIFDFPTHFVDNIFKQALAHFFSTQLNGFTYCQLIKQFYFKQFSSS